MYRKIIKYSFFYVASKMIKKFTENVEFPFIQSVTFIGFLPSSNNLHEIKVVSQPWFYAFCLLIISNKPLSMQEYSDAQTYFFSKSSLILEFLK